MAGPSTQYLQVPKALPYRKLRSRSKSRSREPTPASTPPTPGSPKIRSHSPPIPSFQSPYKAPLSGFTPAADSSTHAMPNGQPVMAHGPMSSHVVRPPSPPSKSVSIDTASNGSNSINYEDLNGDFYTLQRWVTPPIEEQEKRQLTQHQFQSKTTWQDPQEPQYAYVPLRQRLVGCWKLESYTAFPTPESTVQRPTYPMTRNVTGMILYTPDGYMSAQMLIPGQQSFKRGEGAEPQWAEAAKRSFTYCGPYYISDEGSGREEILRHTFQVCNLPGWIGDIQVRTCRFEEDGQVLVLGSEEPTVIKGDKRIPVLKWRRARDNSQGVPPPPMPQIKISGPGEP